MLSDLVLGWLFQLVKAIPIAPRTESPQVYAAAMAAAVQRLEEGELVCIFPEGSITRDGQLQEIKGGVLKLLQSAQSRGVTVPVIPMALTHLWGSFFSRIENGIAMVKPLRRGGFNQVGLQVGEPMAGDHWALQDLQQQVEALLKPEQDATA